MARQREGGTGGGWYVGGKSASRMDSKRGGEDGMGKRGWTRMRGWDIQGVSGYRMGRKG